MTTDTAQDGRNWFAYVKNRPVDLVDADGQQAEHTAHKSPGNWDKHSKKDSGDPEKKDWKMNRPKKKGPPSQAPGGRAPQPVTYPDPVYHGPPSVSENQAKVVGYVIVGVAFVAVVVLTGGWGLVLAL